MYLWSVYWKFQNTDGRSERPQKNLRYILFMSWKSQCCYDVNSASIVLYIQCNLNIIAVISCRNWEADSKLPRGKIKGTARTGTILKKTNLED